MTRIIRDAQDKPEVPCGAAYNWQCTPHSERTLSCELRGGHTGTHRQQLQQAPSVIVIWEQQKEDENA